jgi:AcrR family transcriptional regulator
MGTIAVREDIKDLILDAADRLLARYGYRKMTIDDLASEVGIGKGTVYLHFSSKEEVVLSHVDRIVSRLLERLEEIAGSGATPAEKIKEILVARVIMRFDSVQHYTESLTDVLRSLRSPLLKRREKHFESEAAVFIRILREGERAKAFRSQDDVFETAHAFLSATNSLLPFSLSTQELGERREVERRASKIADLLLEGLQTKLTR